MWSRRRASTRSVWTGIKAQYGYLRRVTPVCRCLLPFCGWRHLATSRESKAHFGLPGYAPGTIAVNETWMERGFNACKTPCCIYPSIFNHFWDISIYRWRVLVENCDIFLPHLCLAAPQGMTRRNFAKIFIYTKLEWMGYRVVKKACSAVLIQYQRVTDGQTDGRTSSL